MAQHFLLSAKARTLRLRDVFAAGEDANYATFRRLRWPTTDGAPVCPVCGSLDAYEITTRRRFKCAACRTQYSVTSGTILHSRKKSFTDLLAAVCIVANGAKGISALQLARDIGCQHKTAFVLAHKIREALASETATATLAGEVEIDGMYTACRRRWSTAISGSLTPRARPEKAATGARPREHPGARFEKHLSGLKTRASQATDFTPGFGGSSNGRTANSWLSR